MIFHAKVLYQNNFSQFLTENNIPDKSSRKIFFSNVSQIAEKSKVTRMKKKNTT